MSDANALEAAGHDADANAGDGNVGAPVSSCHAHKAAPVVQPTPTPKPTPTPTPTPTPSPRASLWVRLALTKDQASNETGSLRLHGAAGYDRTIQISDNFVANAEENATVDVHFENVPTHAKYSLVYISSDKQSWTLLKSVPYNQLNDTSRSKT